MSSSDETGRVLALLRNTPVRELVSALGRDGFELRRTTRTGGHIFRHADGRSVVIHYHHGGDTLPRETLRNVLENAGWKVADLERLGLS